MRSEAVGELQEDSWQNYMQWIGGLVRNDGGCPIVARPAIGNWHFTGLNCGPDKPRNGLDDKHFRDWIFVD